MIKNKNLFIVGITLVATLGGLLFGYDTAVISGTVKFLEKFFLLPLVGDQAASVSMVIQYKFIVSFCVVIIGFLIAKFIVKLYTKKKAIIINIVIWSSVLIGMYFFFLDTPNILTETMLSALKGFIVSSALIGCIIGGGLAGIISESLGRKKGLIIAGFLFLISAIGSALPEYLNFMNTGVVSSFIFYRILGGIGVGMASMISPMYIAEIAPASKRGKLVSFNQFAIIFGMLIVYFVNYFIAKGSTDEWLSSMGWRWMFASETIPATLFVAFLFFVPESPRFLVKMNREKEASSVLEKIFGNKAGEIFSEIKQSLEVKKAHWLKFGWSVLIIGIFLSVFQQFVGINVVLYYAPEIFKNLGSGTDSALLQTIIVGAINLSFTVLAILSVDKIGRKPLLIIGSLGMGIAMISLGLCFFLEASGTIALISMLVYTASFALSWGPVVWVLLSEMFPNLIRGAMAMAVAAQWLSNLLISWTFPMMNDSTSLTNLFNHGFSYWIYGVMGIISAVFVWKWVPETKGKTLEEMESLWKK